MKRVFLLVMAAALLLGLAACTDPIPPTTDDAVVPTSGYSESTGDTAPNDCTEATQNQTEAPTDATPVATQPATEAPTETPTDAPTEAPTEAPHVHSFRSATCTEPKTCSACGATEGAPAGHSWKAATCSVPQQCSACGETSGNANGHHYADGICTVCSETDPSYSSGNMVWIPTKGGKKYHSHSGCSNMDGPDYVTISQAEALGFTPCKRCYG